MYHVTGRTVLRLARLLFYHTCYFRYTFFFFDNHFWCFWPCLRNVQRPQVNGLHLTLAQSYKFRWHRSGKYQPPAATFYCWRVSRTHIHTLCLSLPIPRTATSCSAEHRNTNLVF